MIALLAALNSLSPLGLAGLLAMILFMQVRQHRVINDAASAVVRQHRVINDAASAVAPLPDLMPQVLATLQRIEVALARLNGKGGVS